MNTLPLRYGTNPQQAPARVFMRDGSDLPIAVLGGAPGYINLLDGLNAWLLVRELRQATNLPAAASFKHVSPAGAAVSAPLDETLQKTYFVDGLELSPLATAYARARGADRLCSFGDFIALSDVVDEPTARVIAREVSDGVIAPGYEPAALQILKAKKGGKYAVVKIDPDYEPADTETRDVAGVTFEQRRHDRLVSPGDFTNIVTRSHDLPAAAFRDLMVAWITLKYTQSNSVCFVKDGQAIGVGAGQQSRVHCVRLAGQKADLWRLRQHPAVLSLPFKPGAKRPERDNAIDQFLREDVTPQEKAAWPDIFHRNPAPTDSRRKTRLAGRPDWRQPGLGCLLPLLRQHPSRRRFGRQIHLRAGRLGPRRRSHPGRRRLRHDHGLYGRALVPSLMLAMRRTPCAGSHAVLI
jgi:phosphoribosylaminoimidazolecarboxamide formyltransferase / IMP cyclohydrolase